MPWVAALVAGNAAVALALTRSASAGVALAVVPITLLVVGALVKQRWLLAIAALVLPVTIPVLSQPFAVGGSQISAADIILVLAVASALAARLVYRASGERPNWLSTPVLGWPLVLLGLAVAVAVIRGHYAYGASYLSQPFRLVAFAAIAAAVADLTPRRAHSAIVATMYGVVVWQLLSAVYYLATGTSQTTAADLSTGGIRPLSTGTGKYLVCALFMAVLSLHVDRSAKRRLLHVSFAVLATAGIILSFSRTAFVAVVVILPFLVARRQVLRPLLSVLPLALPFVAVVAIVVPHFQPGLVPTLMDRISLTPHDDLSIEWRKRANSTVWKQVRESPVVGVGFGRISYFDFPTPGGPTLVPQRQYISQDAHQSYLWLLAGGGIVTLSAFLLLLGAYLYDARRRLREAVEPHERVLVLWAVSSLGVWLIACFTEPILTQGPFLLTIWTLLLLPAIVRPRRNQHEAAGAPRAPLQA